MAKTTGDSNDRDDEPDVIDASKKGDDAEGDGEDGEGSEDDDRGDEVGGKIDKKALAKVAGKDGDDKDGEDDAEGSDEDEGGDEGDDKDKPPKTVPYSRLSKVVADRDRLREENATLKAAAGKGGKGDDDADEKDDKKEKPPEFDIDKKEEEYLSLVSQGDDKAALAVRKEINTYLRQSAKTEAVAEATQAMSQAEQAREFGKTVSSLKKQYPWLDEKSDEADEDDIAMVVGLRDKHIAKGKSPSEALKLAAKHVADRRPKEDDDEGEEGDDKDSKGDKDDKEDKVGSRKKEAIERGVKANEGQPPAMSGKGDRSARSSQLDIENMSEEDFEKLPLAEKKRMRGDG